MFVSYYFPVTVCLGIWTLIGRCHTIIGSAWELENFDGSKSIQHSYTVALLFYHFYLWIKKCHLLQFSHSVMSDSLWSHGLQHARPPCPSQTLRVDSKLCPLNGWCHPAISPSVIPFSHLQSFPTSGCFQMSQFLAPGGQNNGVSALASVLPMNIQDWFPLGWTSLNSLLSKGHSRIFSNTTVQKHQFFSAQLSL